MSSHKNGIEGQLEALDTEKQVAGLMRSVCEDLTESLSAALRIAFALSGFILTGKNLYELDD